MSHAAGPAPARFEHARRGAGRHGAVLGCLWVLCSLPQPLSAEEKRPLLMPMRFMPLFLLTTRQGPPCAHIPTSALPISTCSPVSSPRGRTALHRRGGTLRARSLRLGARVSRRGWSSWTTYATSFWPALAPAWDLSGIWVTRQQARLSRVDVDYVASFHLCLSSGLLCFYSLQVVLVSRPTWFRHRGTHARTLSAPFSSSILSSPLFSFLLFPSLQLLSIASTSAHGCILPSPP